MKNPSFEYCTRLIYKCTLHDSLKQSTQLPTYGVFISQLIRYARACQDYTDVLYCARILKNRLLGQGYVATRLKSSLQKFYGCHHELVDRYGVSICAMKTDLFNVS